MPTSACAGLVYFHVWLNGEMLRFHLISLSQSTHCGGFVGFRADVGIGPYTRVEPYTIQRTSPVSAAKALPGGAGHKKDSYKLKA